MQKEVISIYNQENITKTARVIQVIETIENRGKGTEEDPVREIARYWDFEGNLLGETELYDKPVHLELRRVSASIT